MDREPRRHSFALADDERTGHRERPHASPTVRGGRRSRATSNLAGRRTPFRMFGIPTLFHQSSSGRQSGHRPEIAKTRRSSLRWTLTRQSSNHPERPSHLGRSHSVRAPVDPVREPRGARQGLPTDQSAAAVTLRLGPLGGMCIEHRPMGSEPTCPKTAQATFVLVTWRTFLAMISNLARTIPAHFPTRREHARARFIATVRRSPPEVSNTSTWSTQKRLQETAE